MMQRVLWLVGAVMLAGTTAFGCRPRAEPPVRPDRPGTAADPVPRRATDRPTGTPPNRLNRETALALERAEQDRYWLSARETVDKQVMELLAQHETELKKGLRHDKLLRGDPGRKWVALTFDDGPHPEYTPGILRLLKQYQVKATFFLVGEMAEKYPELVTAELTDGHSIGNHTYHHVSLTKMPQEYVATEIKACGEVLQSITGKAPRLFRPPGGDYSDSIAETVEALGYRLILWTDDPGDWASPGQQVILKRTLSAVNNGAIILIHDGIQETLDILPTILQAVKAQGYELVTIDQMLPGHGVGSRPGATGMRVSP